MPGGSTAASASNLALNSSTAASAAANRSRIVRCSLSAAAKRASASLRCALGEIKSGEGGRGQGLPQVCARADKCKRGGEKKTGASKKSPHFRFEKRADTGTMNIELSIL